MPKTIIISEDIANTLNDSLEMTQFKFKANIKKFLAELLEDPVGAQPGPIFTTKGLDKNSLIKHLVDNRIITKSMRIDDHDKDGNPHTAKMIVKYSVPKERFNDRLDALYDTLFPNVEGKINEDGGGATSCSGVDGNGFGSGEFVQPLFGGITVRKTGKKKKDVGGNPYTLTEDIDELNAYHSSKADFNEVDTDGNLYNKDNNLVEPEINSQRQVSESKIRNMIKNTINEMLLTEGDDRLKKVQRTIEREFNGLFDPNATVTSSEYYINNNPNTTWLQYLIFSLRHTFGLMSNADVKYLPLVANLAFSNEVGFEKRNDNGRELRLLGQIVNLIKKDDNLFNQLNKVKDTITFSQVYEQLKPQLESIAMADSESANKVEIRDDYDIIEITSYAQAHEIGNHSCSESKLCYTQSEDIWNQYTGNGINRPYVCLKKGWEQIPEEVGHNNPYDEYGTSMIFVFIGPDGNISASNCRWNHHTTGQYINGNVDQAFTKTLLAETVGRSFNSTFKPYTRDELHSNGVIMFDEVPELLAQGKAPRDIFYLVGDFENGFAWVKLNNKYNFLRKDGRLLSPNQWFDMVSNFKNGFARVTLDNKCNYLREDGTLVLDKPVDQWFDVVGNFYDGFARVGLNNKYNFLREDGTLLLDKPVDQWFDNVGVFYDGFAMVELNNRWNYLREDGTLLSPNLWFDVVDGIYDGFARISLNNKWNFLRKDGRLVWDKPVDQWFNDVDNFENGFAWVELNRTEYLLDTNGNLYNSPSQISESKIHNMIKNAINEMLLTEADDRLKKVQRTIEREFNGLFDPNATVTSSEYYINNNPDTTWLQYLIFSLRHTFGLMSNADVKYLPLVANLAFSNEVGFEKRDDNGRELRLLGQIVNLIKKDDNLFNQLNKVKDTITFSQVYEQLKPQLESIARADSEAANNVETRDDYDIVEITSYEQAHEIGNHSCSESKLCYTQSESTWNQYTANGVNRPYVCLKKGWEQVPEQPGENNPYDEYGTSMIFVFIGPDGSITTSNCRWNHHITGKYMNGNVDQAFDKATLAQTVGVPFDSVFKPYDREYLHSKGIILLNEIPGLLAQGKSPRDIFDYVGNFKNGFAIVKLNRKYNFLSEDGRLLNENQWFDYASKFYDGIAKVELNNKYNFISDDGRLLSPDQWFDEIYNFYDGFGIVNLNHKWNFLRKDGRLVWNKPIDQWFDDVDDFNNGFAWVELNGTDYLLDTNGNLYDLNKNLIEPAINSQRRVSESKIRNMIKNTINEMLLTEADDRLKKVQRTIEREFKGSLDPNATVTSSEYYVNNNPSTTWLQYLIFSLRHTFGLMSNADVKYLPLVANLAFSNEVGFEKRNDNGKELRLLGQIVNLIKKDTNLFNELNKVKDNITFSQVYEQLKPQLESIARADSEAANNVEVRNDYDIVEITSYAQAHKIGNKSCSSSKLCYTQSEDTWNQYTANGVNKPYVCLKKGWERIPEQPGENNPYDEYGTSMIFVFIDPEGNISTSNCRWNHHTTGQYMNGNVDQAFDKATLAQTVGVPFDSTFKPYDREYLHSRGIIMLDEIPGLLAQGKDPRDIFDYVGNFYDGFAIVSLNDRYNFLREDGRLLRPNQWFYYVGNFYEGFARVKLNNKYNSLREDGTLVWDKPVDQWFDDFDYFYDGFAEVRLNRKYNLLRKDGTLVWDKPVDQWFNLVDGIYDGFALVELNDTSYLLGSDGNLYDLNKNLIEPGNQNYVAESIISNIVNRVINESYGYGYINGDSYAPLVKYLPLINKKCGTDLNKKDLPYLHDILDSKHKSFLGYPPRKKELNNGTVTLVYGKRDMEYLFGCKIIIELIRDSFRYTLNEAITGEDGRKSSAVYAYAKNNNGEWCILAAKRAKEWDDEGGKMNPPMGHRHKYESPEDGAVRECEEESGIRFNKSDLVLASKEDWGTNFKIYLPGKTSDYKPGEGDEENSKFRWIPINKINDYQWAWSCGTFAKRFAPKK